MEKTKVVILTIILEIFFSDCLLAIAVPNSNVTSKQERCSLTLDIIRSRGFKAEFYTIETNGYPLTLYRIINPLADLSKLNRYPVLYGHGLLYDAMSMISRAEHSKPRKPLVGKPTVIYGDYDSSTSNSSKVDDYSLPFMFSNNNFDVWLFDSKGTNEQNRSPALDINLSQSRKFWDFSLDDEALVDLPLMIDFVLLKTKAKKLVYVGYSQSTLFLFALLTTAPEYSDKLVAAVTMAPVAYVGHIKGLSLPLLAPLDLVPNFVHHTLLPQTLIDTVDTSMKNICKTKDMSELICGTLLKKIGGDGVGEMAPNFFSSFFKSTSLKAVKQFIQLFSGKRFGMYDYGITENLKRYNMSKPPGYDLSRLKSEKLILVRGGKDFLSTPEDQALLIKDMGKEPYLDINIPQYNHFDFIDGHNLIRLVNEPVMKAVYELMYREGSSIVLNEEELEKKLEEQVEKGPSVSTIKDAIATLLPFLTQNGTQKNPDNVKNTANASSLTSFLIKSIETEKVSIHNT